MTQDSAFEGVDIEKYLQLHVLQIPGTWRAKEIFVTKHSCLSLIVSNLTVAAQAGVVSKSPAPFLLPMAPVLSGLIHEARGRGRSRFLTLCVYTYRTHSMSGSRHRESSGTGAMGCVGSLAARRRYASTTVAENPPYRSRGPPPWEHDGRPSRAIVAALRGLLLRVLTRGCAQLGPR